MPNNFKLTGYAYVSVDGSDSNSGLTKDLPKRTVQAGWNLVNSGNRTLVIGAGTYAESLGGNWFGPNVAILADGLVVLDGGNIRSIGFSNSSGGSGSCTGVVFRNYASVSWTHTFTLSNCSIINCPSSSLNTITVFSSCYIINSTLNNTSTNALQFNYCVAINSTLSGNSIANSVSSLTNSCLISCLINIRSGVAAASFNYNNIINCSVMMGSATGVTTGTYQDIYGRYYDLSQAGTNPSGDGSLVQPFWRAQTSGVAFSYTNHRILYPTFNANSISQDPKFNRIEALDFTLQADSPMIARAGDGVSNIGGTKYAIRHAANGSAFNTAAVSITGLTMAGTNWTSTGTNGQVISSPIFISNTVKVVQTIRYNGLLEFNKALGAGPVAGNRNVPDNYVYGTGTQGANPDRLVYEIRYSTQVAEPASDSEWDNGSYITAGNYFVMEWNTKPSFDTAFVGNGDPTFNASATPTFLNATWIQLKVTLRNNYV